MHWCDVYTQLRMRAVRLLPSGLLLWIDGRHGEGQLADEGKDGGGLHFR